MLPKSDSIHIVMRYDSENKVSDVEKRTMKKMLLDAFKDFPEEEDEFEPDSAAAQIMQKSTQKMEQPNEKIEQKPKPK